VEQPASLISVLNSPHDKSTDRGKALKRRQSRAGPMVRIRLFPAESRANHRFLSGGAPVAHSRALRRCCWELYLSGLRLAAGEAT